MYAFTAAFDIMYAEYPTGQPLISSEPSLKSIRYFFRTSSTLSSVRISTSLSTSLAHPLGKFYTTTAYTALARVYTRNVSSRNQLLAEYIIPLRGRLYHLKLAYARGNVDNPRRIGELEEVDECTDHSFGAVVIGLQAFSGQLIRLRRNLTPVDFHLIIATILKKKEREKETCQLEFS